MTVKKIAAVTPPFAFEAYSHLVSPIPVDESGGFFFTMPDILGVMGDGVTELAAIKDGREAFLATVSALMDMGREVPAPTLTAQDFASLSASGKFVARVPRSMHIQLAARAKTEGVSLNTLVITLIAEGMGRHYSA